MKKSLIALTAAALMSIPLSVSSCTLLAAAGNAVEGGGILFGKTNDVNPLITIMAVSIGGTLAGMAGIIIALPVYLLIRTTYKFFKKDLKKGMKIVKETI